MSPERTFTFCSPSETTSRDQSTHLPSSKDSKSPQPEFSEATHPSKSKSLTNKSTKPVLPLLYLLLQLLKFTLSWSVTSDTVVNSQAFKLAHTLSTHTFHQPIWSSPQHQAWPVTSLISTDSMGSS